MHPSNRFEIVGSPPPWSVTHIDKFLASALQRAERSGGELPERFQLTMCPWGERNAIGGTPAVVRQTTDPRFTVVHFTGCSRPYLVAIFLSEHATQHQQLAARYLPWSEHYDVEVTDRSILLRFIAATEAPEVEIDERAKARTLRELFHAGELAEW
jgi:hypothetical protein